MTDRELIQQALEALEYAADETKPEGLHGCDCLICKTITALRDRLEQPEQEPVARMSMGVIVKSEIPQFYTGPLYLTSSLSSLRPWTGLTDAELYEFSDLLLGSYDLCLEVEARLKEKNT